MNRKQRRDFQRKNNILHKSPLPAVRRAQEETLYRRAVESLRKQGVVPQEIAENLPVEE